MGEKRGEKRKEGLEKGRERKKWGGGQEKNKEWGRTVSVKIQVDKAFYFIPDTSEGSG